MTCHSGTPVFADIFNRWKSSGHATMFKRSIDSGAAYYTTACMKCHTTGMDHNLVNNNNGFDDVARNVGWTWTPPPAPGKWDNLVTNYRHFLSLQLLVAKTVTEQEVHML
ncbi:MAG: hypothetical protein IPJ45_04850 [Ignavibacteria bacterium]|nr:hypothetical protein [Ignavibacteria bacterium]